MTFCHAIIGTKNNNNFGDAPVFNCVCSPSNVCCINTVITLSFGNKFNVELVCLHLTIAFCHLSNDFHNFICLFGVHQVCVEHILAI